MAYTNLGKLLVGWIASGVVITAATYAWVFTHYWVGDAGSYAFLAMAAITTVICGPIVGPLAVLLPIALFFLL
jgi:hypothetical protein